MVRTRKRITRRDLRKPDQFISLTRRALDALQKHRRRVILGVFLFIVLLTGLWGWRAYRIRQDRLAAQEYSRALSLYHSGRYEEALTALAHIKNYWLSPYSTLALLYEGHSYIDLKRPSEAIPVLEEFLKRQKGDHLLRQLALVTLGYAEEMAGHCPKAVAVFSSAYAVKGPVRGEALLAKARCQVEMGRLAEARDSYQLYLTDHPGSQRANEIILKLQAIEAKIGKAGREKEG